MEVALYCPRIGYYERSILRSAAPQDGKQGSTATEDGQETRIGRAGDFYTSVSVGPLFGQLLAFQFVRWAAAGQTAGGKVGKWAGENWSHSPTYPLSHLRSLPFHLVEAGAHDGRLAADILGWMEANEPGLLERLEYIIVEPSPRREASQRLVLDKFAGRVRWVGSLQQLPAAGVHGVIFSNELFDAFPIHRLGWDAQARCWFEWGVVWNGDGFGWARIPNAEGEVRSAESPHSPLRMPYSALAAAGLEISAGLEAVLPDGFTVEISPTSALWWQRAADRLRHGRLMTFDYGLSAEQFLAPERAHGTLRAYRKHAMARDPLAEPGEQDLTAHVNFTHLQRAGENAGLQTEAFVSQSTFLTQVAEQTWKQEFTFDAWTQAHTRQFQTLTHPGHLGRAFRVLIQSKA